MSWLSIGDINRLRRGRGARLVDEPNPSRYASFNMVHCALRVAERRPFLFAAKAVPPSLNGSGYGFCPVSPIITERLISELRGVSGR